jgi:hypothetical protein
MHASIQSPWSVINSTNIARQGCCRARRRRRHFPESPVQFDLLPHAPYRNFVCGIEVEPLKEVRRFATAEPRR